MSKYVKDLVVQDLKRRLAGVDDIVLVNVIGMEANETVLLRKRLRDQGIGLLVVKNSLVKRATEGTPLSPAFEGLEGCLAVVWGGEDFVSLVKEVTSINRSREFKNFEPRGGVMDGEHLTPEKVKEISKWPNRAEQLSLLVSQVLAPGANLVSQMTSPGGALASQIEQKSEE